MRRLILIITVIFASSWLFLNCNFVFSHGSAVLYFKPASGSFKVGEIFQTEVLLDTKGNAINSARGIITFDPKKLEVLDLGRQNSIFSFWDPNTSFSNTSGEIIFGGGLPSPGFSSPPAGLILKPTFKVKEAGMVDVEFKDAFVLANDAEGTDILGKLEKASYKLEKETLPLPVETPLSRELEPPKITTFPTEISSTEVFYVEGSALAKSTVILYIEKEDEEPIVKEIDTSFDGSWSYIHDKFLQPGRYSIYAKTKTSRGEISESSEKISLLVSKGALEIGGFVIKSETIYGIIILLLIIGILILFGVFNFFNYKEKRDKRKLVKEVKEADQSVVEGFDTLKNEIRRELNVLKNLKITEDHLPLKTRKERREILDDLLEDLELLEKVEKVIKKEVKDVEDILSP